MSVLAQIAGPALLASAPLLLIRAWRRGVEGRRMRLAGWTALLGALLVFGAEYGAARGPALAIAFLPFAALPVIAHRRDRRTARRRSVAEDRNAPSATPRLRGLARFLLAVPMAGAASILAATLCSRLWASMPAGMVAALAIVPLFWSIAMLWTLSDPHLRRPAAGLTLLALTGGLWLTLR